MIPLNMLHLRHHLIDGEVTLGVIDSIPVPGVHLLLGNDLAGGKLFPQTVQDPFSTSSEDRSYLYPACVVTGSQAKFTTGPDTPTTSTSTISVPSINPDDKVFD